MIGTAKDKEGSKKKIVLTGGGTAGHVSSNLALIPRLREEGWEICYIGSYNGIEKSMIENVGIRYYGISSGKLRRYFSLKNFTDPFRVLKGMYEAKNILKQLRPDIVFSKGGFVTVPVVFASSRLNIPVVSHESDFTPGLANRLSIKRTKKICCNFPETLIKLPKDKAVLTGAPIQEALLKGSKEKGLELSGFSGLKPVILIIGGSLGSVAINNAIRANLDALLSKYDIIHICGKGNIDEALEGKPGYRQYDFISMELPHFYALSDLVISRAGANVIFELAALKKPNLLIPLPKEGNSRGDQILNAKSFEKQGFSKVIQQREMEGDSDGFIALIDKLYNERMIYIKAMENARQVNGIDEVMKVLYEVAGI